MVPRLTLADEPLLLSIAEIARQFELPESTARYYCKRFKPFLPHIGQGKKRRFRREALGVFTLILDEMKKRKNAAAVEAFLAARLPGVAPLAPHGPLLAQSESPDLAAPSAFGTFDRMSLVGLMEAQTKALTRIAESMDALAAREDALFSLKAQLDASQGGLAALRQELAAVRAFQDQAEKIHQQDLEQLRKWLAMLAKEQSKPG